MKKLLTLSVAVFALAFSAAASADEFTLNASAYIAPQLGIKDTQDIDFGSIVPSKTATGSVTMAPDGGRTGENVILLSSGNTPVQGQVTVTGAPLTQLTVSFQNGTMTNGTGGTMTITDINSTGGVTTDASGDLPLNIGAKLNIGIAQADGTYAGTYTLVVNY